MSTSKVVKVEEIDQPGLSVRGPDLGPGFDRSKTDQTVSTLLAYGTDSSLLPTREGLYEEDVEIDIVEQEDESRDKVYPLPDNWPKIPQIFRRRSCELTKASSPCINKAVSHLELLQNVIEDWFRQKEEETFREQPVEREALKKELRFSRDPTYRTIQSASSRESALSLRHPTSALSVQGVGISKDEETEQEIPKTVVPFLGAEDVIDEVMTLLARLENDRQDTDVAYEREKERVVRLADKVDSHCRRRITELPAVVQKEHEECIIDLNELQWHVAYSSRNQERIKGRMDIAEVLNRRLKEDIEFVKKHIPLVEEKLELELEAMSKIRNAQTDTDQELDVTITRQNKTEAKSSEAFTKAETERGHIKHELDTVKDALSNINEELSEAKMTFNAYSHQINDMQQQLKDNEQELKVLEVKNENARVAEEMQGAKVRDIQGKIMESESEHARLDAENTQLTAELNARKTQYGNTIRELELAIKGRDNKLRLVVRKNQEVEMEVQDLMDKIGECQRQKVSDEKNVARIHKEMQKVQQQMSVTTDEFNRVAGINANIRDTLVNEQEKTFKMEESLKITAETLKKQVKDEVHTRTVLSSRITADTQDLQKSRVEIREKKNKMMFDIREGKAAKVADDVLTAVGGVRQKVEKLRTTKQDKVQKKRELSAQREETVKRKEESTKRFNERLTQIEPHHSHLKGDLLNVNKRLDHMEWKSDVMKNKMEDMDKSQGMMDRLVTNTAKSLDTLTSDLEEINIQLEAHQKMEDDLRIQYNEVLGRIRSNEANHRSFIDERHKVQRDLEMRKKKSIQENTDLASQYRTAQNDYMTLKDKLMNNFENRVKLENAIKDCRQLQALQVRMHSAMLEYYKYRGLYNTSELTRMEDSSYSNSKKVTALQENMDSALKNITNFIQTQMTGDHIKKVAWDAVKKQEKKEEAREAKRKAKTLTDLKTSKTVEVNA